MNIQWYPGHMTKTRRQIEADLKQVDAICEIVDARIPISSRNPDIDSICGSKPRIIVLNRMDLADPNATKRWLAYFRGRGMAAVAAAQVYVKERGISVTDAKELLQLLFVYCYFLYSHSSPHKRSFGDIIPQFSSRNNRLLRRFFAEKPMQILSHNSILCFCGSFAPILRDVQAFSQNPIVHRAKF